MFIYAMYYSTLIVSSNSSSDFSAQQLLIIFVPLVSINIHDGVRSHHVGNHCSSDRQSITLIRSDGLIFVQNQWIYHIILGYFSTRSANNGKNIIQSMFSGLHRTWSACCFVVFWLILCTVWSVIVVCFSSCCVVRSLERVTQHQLKKTKKTKKIRHLYIRIENTKILIHTRE